MDKIIHYFGALIIGGCSSISTHNDDSVLDSGAALIGIDSLSAIDTHEDANIIDRTNILKEDAGVAMPDADIALMDATHDSNENETSIVKNTEDAGINVDTDADMVSNKDADINMADSEIAKNDSDSENNCIPRSCENQNGEVSCGIIDDGCGNTIDCNNCESYKSDHNADTYICNNNTNLCENGCRYKSETTCEDGSHATWECDPSVVTPPFDVCTLITNIPWSLWCCKSN